MNKNILLYGSIGVCLILILASLSPVVGYQCVESDVEENKENYDEKDIFYSKKYLFETIIEIANNPDIKRLSYQYNLNLFTSDFGNKDVLKQLFFKNFYLLSLLLFTKQSLSYNYLDSIYNKGTKLAGFFSEDDISEIMESLTFTNPEILDKSNKIIKNDEMLYKKISTLKEMNKDIKSNQRLWNFTIICTILAIIVLPVYMLGVVAYMGGWVFPSLARTAFQILFLLLVPIMTILLPLFLTGALLGCWQ